MSRHSLLFALLLFATVALFTADLAVGSVALSPGEVWQALTGRAPILSCTTSC